VLQTGEGSATFALPKTKKRLISEGNGGTGCETTIDNPDGESLSKDRVVETFFE
jgi:hypothetical protein